MILLIVRSWLCTVLAGDGVMALRLRSMLYFDFRLQWLLSGQCLCVAGCDSTSVLV